LHKLLSDRFKSLEQLQEFFNYASLGLKFTFSFFVMLLADAADIGVRLQAEPMPTLLHNFFLSLALQLTVVLLQ